MKKKIILIGGGGHCRSCIDVIECCDDLEVKGVLDQSHEVRIPDPYPLLGQDSDMGNVIGEKDFALITVGQIQSSTVRQRLYSQLKRLNKNIIKIKSPTAYCSQRTEVGDGTIIMHGAIVNSCARIGNNCIINTMALIEHDVEIGDHCHISTGVRLNGTVVVGTGTFVGSGSTIREGVRISAYSVIPAGSVVMRDI